MPQQQRIIEVKYSDGTKGKAIATGNNAAWVCKCGRKEPLLGKSGHVHGPGKNTKVVCPNCEKEFFVEPDGGDDKKAVSVIEL